MKLSLESVARLVSIGFYLLAVLAAALISPRLGLPTPLLPLLMLCSSYYVYYARTPTIETAALASNAAYLCAAAHHQPVPALALSCLAVCVKLNATPFFWLAAILLDPADPRTYLPILAGGCCGLLWTWRCDAIKRRHPISRLTQLSHLPCQRRWNFGTLVNRCDPYAWQKVLDRSAMLCPFGLAGTLLAALAMHSAPAAVCCGLYLLAPLIFWNLHVTHGYYTCANGVFLLAGAACALAALPPWAMTLGAGAFLAMSAWRWSLCYRRTQLADTHEHAQIVEHLRQVCPPDGVIGTQGIDWSPLIPFLARRRAAMLPNWPEMSVEAAKEMTANLKAHGHRLAATLIPTDKGLMVRAYSQPSALSPQPSQLHE